MAINFVVQIDCERVHVETQHPKGELLAWQGPQATLRIRTDCGVRPLREPRDRARRDRRPAPAWAQGLHHRAQGNRHDLH